MERTELEALVQTVGRHLDRPTLVRVIVAVAGLARSHAPVRARRWDSLLALADAWAHGRASLDEVRAARRTRIDDAAGAAERHYASIARASILAATAEAEQPSLFGPTRAACASEIEVCLDAVGWALTEATALLSDALTDLGGAFVPDAGAQAREHVREVVEATLAEAFLDRLPPPA